MVLIKSMNYSGMNFSSQEKSLWYNYIGKTCLQIFL